MRLCKACLVAWQVTLCIVAIQLLQQTILPAVLLVVLHLEVHTKLADLVAEQEIANIAMVLDIIRFQKTINALSVKVMDVVFVVMEMEDINSN